MWSVFGHENEHHLARLYGNLLSSLLMKEIENSKDKHSYKNDSLCVK